MTDMPIFEDMKRYFEERLEAHGASALAVDWNSQAAQEIRFAQLSKVITGEQPFSLLDYGCGYGALAGYLLRQGFALERYLGFDLIEAMVAKAREEHAGQPRCQFTASRAELAPQDYAIASGIFNLKLDAPGDQWTEYVTGELHQLDRYSRKGFSANFLTKYSDPEYMRPHLYYADPGFLFDYCKRRFSRNVALLHDYEVYDFTIIVRKAG
jgi:SAM-dependent methyltransferase